MIPFKILFTTAEAAEVLGYKKSTLETWRYRPRENGAPMPRYIRQGDTIRYHIDDLREFARLESEGPHLKAVAS